MCGICGVFAPSDATQDMVEDMAEKLLERLRHRGPDNYATLARGHVALGHSRLAIVDPDDRSNQPFTYGRTTIVFNGEIWNWRELRSDLEGTGRRFHTEGDTELVAAAIDTWGEGALGEFNGMFAVAWTDQDGSELRLARDRFGEIPLHYTMTEDASGVIFASELKALPEKTRNGARWVDPGRLYAITRIMDRPGGSVSVSVRNYADLRPPAIQHRELDEAAGRVREHLEASCAEREMSDVPVCAMLSGGVDSAAITAMLRASMPDLVCYTAVLDPKSRDLKMARRVADHLELELVEVQVPEPTAEDLARTVRTIELPHKAQVEIGWACVHLAERMRSDGFKVTYSGEGSDELWGSYGFAYHSLGDDPSDTEFRGYRSVLFATQHRKNFPRANKAFMSSGVECRLPFLNPGLVEYALTLPRDAVQETKRRPKAVLQRAVMDLLPEEVVKRPKMAFQDGMGMKEAAATAVAKPQGFYKSEYRREYGRAQ